MHLVDAVAVVGLMAGRVSAAPADPSTDTADGIASSVSPEATAETINGEAFLDTGNGRDDSTPSAHRLRLLGVNQRGQHQPKKDTGVASTATNNIIRRDYDEDVVRHYDNDINLRGFQSHQDVVVDAGLLSGSHATGAARRLADTPSNVLTVTDSCPDDTHVNCISGQAFQWNDSTVDLGIVCDTACGDGCCQGTNACSGTTACIQKDGDSPSCDGTTACYDAGNSDSKPVIANGSCVGDKSCYNLASLGGVAPLIDNSCKGESACYRLARVATVGAIQDSCVGKHACKRLATDGMMYMMVGVAASGGSDVMVGAIRDSCCGENACYEHCCYVGYCDGTPKVGLPECGEDLISVAVTETCPSSLVSKSSKSAGSRRKRGTYVYGGSKSSKSALPSSF